MKQRWKGSTLRNDGKTTAPRPAAKKKGVSLQNLQDAAGNDLPLGIVAKFPNPTKKLPLQKISGRKKGN